MNITLGQSYFDRGMFNVPIEFTDELGEHNTYFSIDTGKGLIEGCRVDRLSNRKGTPRIWLNRQNKYWFQDNYQIGDVIVFEIVNQELLRVIH